MFIVPICLPQHWTWQFRIKVSQATLHTGLPHSPSFKVGFSKWCPHLTQCLNIPPLTHSSSLQNLQTSWLPEKQQRLTWQSTLSHVISTDSFPQCLLRSCKLANSWWFSWIFSSRPSWGCKLQKWTCFKLELGFLKWDHTQTQINKNQLTCHAVNSIWLS